MQYADAEEKKEEEIEEEDMEKKIKGMRMFKYIGETARSCYERAWEHANNLSTLRASCSYITWKSMKVKRCGIKS